MSKKVLLIADDDQMNRVVIKKFLQDKYEVLEAVNGKETIDYINSVNIDAVLLDIIMPGMNGLEVLEYIKDNEKFKDIGILVATSTKEKTERTALALGADDIVAKPYDPVVINKRLENILTVKEMQRQKKMLQSSDIDELIKRNLDIYLSDIGTSTERLRKIASIINSNISNVQLLRDMTDEIVKESECIDKVLSESI